MFPAAVTSFVTDAVKTILSDAFSGVASDVISIATTALPFAISIAGFALAIRLGIKFFKSVAN